MPHFRTPTLLSLALTGIGLCASETAWIPPAPPAPVVPASQAAATCKLAPGYSLELVASEPLINDPVQIAFDPAGRLWVVEMTGFMPTPEALGEDHPNGKIVILEDTNHDGVMDKSTVFLDNLVLPRALTLIDGGAIIAEPPHLWLCKDTNGDLVSDMKTELCADYGSVGNPEHTANGLLRGIDNWIYSANHGLRYRREGDAWRSEVTIMRGQWGISQDDAGRLFYNSNSDPLRADLLPAEFLDRNPHQTTISGYNVDMEKVKETWPIRVNPGVNRGYQENILRAKDSRAGLPGSLRRFTAACGPCVYRGDLMPELSGNVFIGEPAANLVRRTQLSSNGYNQSGTNPYSEKEFIASNDERFRPVNFANGPDGALYVVDMYKGIIQHRIYLTPYLRDQALSRGLDQPLHLGRIFRVVPSAKTVAHPQPMLEHATTTELIMHLGDAGGWWRETAQRLLIERADPTAVPALRIAAVGPNALARMHALWTLDGFNVHEPALLATAFTDTDARVRAAAVRLAQPLIGKSNATCLNAPLYALLSDDDAYVRLQVALLIGTIPEPQALHAMGDILRRDGQSPLVREAIVSGLKGRESELLKYLLDDSTWMTSQAGLADLLSLLAECIQMSNDPVASAQVEAWARAQPSAQGWRHAALSEGLAKGKKIGENKIDHGEKVGSILPAEARTRIAQGKKQYAIMCAACHQPDGHGMAGIAPPLAGSKWVTGNPQQLIRIVLHGVTGPITAAETTFAGEMPPMGAGLDDATVANILSYIRLSWNNATEPIYAGQITTIRTKEGAHEAWSVSDLEKIK